MYTLSINTINRYLRFIVKLVLYVSKEIHISIKTEVKKIYI